MKSWILESFPLAVYKRVRVLAVLWSYQQACVYVFPIHDSVLLNQHLQCWCRIHLVQLLFRLLACEWQSLKSFQSDATYAIHKRKCVFASKHLKFKTQCVHVITEEPKKTDNIGSQVCVYVNYSHILHALYSHIFKPSPCNKTYPCVKLKINH